MEDEYRQTMRSSLLHIDGAYPVYDNGVHALRKIEWCGRISHRSEEAQTHDSWDRFIRTVVLQHGDWSIVEHASATVDALVDRGITHEWVRHRLFSIRAGGFQGLSNYEKKMLGGVPSNLTFRPPLYSGPTEVSP